VGFLTSVEVFEDPSPFLTAFPVKIHLIN
jgi:hypothetical protein